LKRQNVRKIPVFIGAFFSLVKKITVKLIVCNREFSSKTGPVVQTNQGADHERNYMGDGDYCQIEDCEDLYV
jgi:hypothetical protein